MSATLLPPWENKVLVTYVVDTGTTYTEKVKKNADCLNPETFTPEKSGYTFAGWREDTTASGDVLTEKTAEKGLVLYAVFEKSVTVTYYATSSSRSAITGTRYYNNGNLNDPVITIADPALSGWTFEGWVTSNSATASVVYGSLANGVEFSEDATIYGKFSCVVTVTYYATSSTKATATGTRYFNAYGNYANPTISISNPSLSGWTFLGWVTSTSATATVAYSSLSSGAEFSEDITIYGKFSCTVTITYYATSSSKSTATGTRYFNAYGNYSDPTFTISDPTLSGWTFEGWCTSTSATESVEYSSIGNMSFSSDTTLYGKFSCTVTITYYATSSSKSTATGTRYFNAYGNYSNPTFTISNPSLSGWTFQGWCTSTSATASVAYSSISSTTFSSDTTLYGKFSCTITLSYNGNSSTSGSTSSQTGTRYFNAYGNYSNPSFTLRSNGFTRTSYTWYAWASGSTSGTQYAAGASVTLTANTTFYACWAATTTNFSYTGGVQSFTTVCAGTYKFEVYGAAGGNGYYSGYNYAGDGGKGGYAYGSVTLSKGTTVYVVVGGQGTAGSSSGSASGGYNGGGSTKCNNSGYCGGGGGGCTHMAKVTGLLKNISSSNVYIVGGGGGGGGCGTSLGSSYSRQKADGGYGGGSSGGAGYPVLSNYSQTTAYGCGQGGTQSAGGSGYNGNGGFGYGGDDTSSYDGAGGGGGYYGGGTGSDYNGGGGAGGGSGYTGGMSSSTGMTSGSRSGNGYATITLVSAS